jgi:hypothetical protein
MRPARLPHWGSRLWHAVLIAVGWLAFFWFWVIVLGRPWGSLDLWLLIVVPLVTAPAVTGIWILHNLAIYRRKGPRRAVRTVDLSYSIDFYGRRVAADWANLASQRRIDIVIDGDVKRYVAVAPELAAATTGAGKRAEFGTESARIQAAHRFERARQAGGR